MTTLYTLENLHLCKPDGSDIKFVRDKEMCVHLVLRYGWIVAPDWFNDASQWPGPFDSEHTAQTWLAIQRLTLS